MKKIDVIIDCADPDRCKVLGRRPRLPQVLLFGPYPMRCRGGPGFPRLALQQVSDPKAGKSRMHLDIVEADIDAEARQAGATRGSSPRRRSPTGTTRRRGHEMDRHGRPRRKRVLRLRRRVRSRYGIPLILCRNRSARPRNLSGRRNEPGGRPRTAPSRPGSAGRKSAPLCLSGSVSRAGVGRGRQLVGVEGLGPFAVKQELLSDLVLLDRQHRPQRRFGDHLSGRLAAGRPQRGGPRGSECPAGMEVVLEVDDRPDRHRAVGVDGRFEGPARLVRRPDSTLATSSGGSFAGPANSTARRCSTTAVAATWAATRLSDGSS
jgi:hypothetical protein